MFSIWLHSLPLQAVRHDWSVTSNGGIISSVGTRKSFVVFTDHPAEHVLLSRIAAFFHSLGKMIDHRRMHGAPLMLRNPLIHDLPCPQRYKTISCCNGVVPRAMAVRSYQTGGNS